MSSVSDLLGQATTLSRLDWVRPDGTLVWSWIGAPGVFFPRGPWTGPSTGLTGFDELWPYTLVVSMDDAEVARFDVMNRDDEEIAFYGATFKLPKK